MNVICVMSYVKQEREKERERISILLAMASLTHLLTVIVVVFLGLLSSSANARPCKTLLISSYSISFKPTFHRRNPNFLFLDKTSPSSVRPQSEPEAFVTIFTSSSSSSSRFFIDRPKFLRPVDNEFPQFRPAREEDDAAFGLFNSLRDRTKDVLSVVVALLFGVGCGALTAGTMYLAYSFFRATSYYSNHFNYYESDDEDEDFSPKKSGYVKIPTAVDATPPKVVDIAIQPSEN